MFQATIFTRVCHNLMEPFHSLLQHLLRQGNAPLFIRVVSLMYIANDIVLSRLSLSDLYMYCLGALLVEPEVVVLLWLFAYAIKGFVSDLGSLQIEVALKHGIDVIITDSGVFAVSKESLLFIFIIRNNGAFDLRQEGRQWSHDNNKLSTRMFRGHLT